MISLYSSTLVAGGQDNNRQYTKTSNAYMLVYVRLSDWSRIMSEPSESDLDDGLRSRFAVSARDEVVCSRFFHPMYMFHVVVHGMCEIYQDFRIS